MPVPQHLSLVTLGVVDVARSTAFFESLGWVPLEGSSAEITFFQAGGVVLGLYGRDALAADAQVPAAGSGFRAVTLAINLPSPTHVDAAMSAWVAAGGRLVKAAGKVEWGGYSGYVADLDDQLWEIAFNPYSPQWAAEVPD